MSPDDFGQVVDIPFQMELIVQRAVQAQDVAFERGLNNMRLAECIYTISLSYSGSE
jgi:hypothetical protein